MTAPARLRTVSIALVSIGAACVLALHVLRRDLPPMDHRLSEYANGRWGFLMTAAFVAIGAGLVAFGFAIRPPRRPLPVVVTAAGAAMVTAGIFRTGPDRVGAASDAIHSRASALATLALIGVAVTCAVARQRRLRSWRPDVAGLLAAAAGVLGALSPLLHRTAWTGLSQRLLWLTLVTWVIVTAWPGHPGRASGPDRQHRHRDETAAA